MRRRTADAVALHKNPLEEEWQSTLVAWCRCQARARPGLETIFHVPNFRHMTGSRGARAGQVSRLRRQGFVDGVSDLLLLLPSGPWHGAAMELKRRGLKPTEDQVGWLAQTRRAGFACVCVDAFEHATAWLECYYDAPLLLERRFPVGDDFRLIRRKEK